jgi:hypothetical protein
MTGSRSIAAAVLAAGTLATSASAGIELGDTLSMTFLSVQPSRAVSATFNGNTSTIHGGVLNWNVTGHGTIRTFCTQIDESVATGTTLTYDVVDIEQVPDSPPGPGPMGDARATLIRDLYSRNYDNVMGATGNAARDQAAAFAMVIWEITHQDSTATSAAGLLADLNLTAGNAQFVSTSTVNSIANAMLAGLGGGTGDFMSTIQVLGATNPDNQDVLIVVPGPAGIAALAGLVAVRRRRRG